MWGSVLPCSVGPVTQSSGSHRASGQKAAPLGTMRPRSLYLGSWWRPSQGTQRRLPAALRPGRLCWQAPACSCPLPGGPMQSSPTQGWGTGMPSTRVPTCAHTCSPATDSQHTRPHSSHVPHPWPCHTQPIRDTDSPAERPSLPAGLPVGSPAVSPAAGSPVASAGSIPRWGQEGDRQREECRPGGERELDLTHCRAAHQGPTSLTVQGPGGLSSTCRPRTLRAGFRGGLDNEDPGANPHRHSHL